MAYTIERLYVCKVVAEHMEGPAYIEGRVVDNKVFFPIAKDHATAKIMCGDGHKRKDALSKTTIIDDMKRLRDDALRSELGVKNGQRWSKKHIAKALLLEDSIYNIETHRTNDIDGVSIWVLMGKPGSVLWVELSSKNLSYIATVTAAQRDNFAMSSPDKHSDDPVENALKNDKGMNVVNTGKMKGTIRVRVPIDDKRKRYSNKYVKTGDDVNDAINVARTTATRIQLGVSRIESDGESQSGDACQNDIDHDVDEWGRA